MSDTLLGASHRALDEARFLHSGGFHGAAVSHAYYAAFYAAEEALRAVGEARSKHSGVVSAFGRIVVRERGFDEETGRVLRRLFRQRIEADYVVHDAPASEAEAALADAERFVTAVERWLEEPPG